MLTDNPLPTETRTGVLKTFAGAVVRVNICNKTPPGTKRFTLAESFLQLGVFLPIDVQRGYFLPIMSKNSSKLTIFSSWPLSCSSRARFSLLVTVAHSPTMSMVVFLVTFLPTVPPA